MMMSLNRKQKVVVIVGMGLILLSFVFPRWQANSPNLKYGGVARVESLGYSFFLKPPASEWGWLRASIDYSVLYPQLAVILLLTTGCVLVLKDQRRKERFAGFRGKDGMSETPKRSPIERVKALLPNRGWWKELFINLVIGFVLFWGLLAIVSNAWRLYPEAVEAKLRLLNNPIGPILLLALLSWGVRWGIKRFRVAEYFLEILKKLLIVLRKTPDWLAVVVFWVLVIWGLMSLHDPSESSVPDEEEQAEIKQMLIEVFYDHPGRGYLSNLNPGQSKVQVFEVMGGWTGKPPEIWPEIEMMVVDTDVWRDTWHAAALATKPYRTGAYEVAQGQIEVLYYFTGVEQPLTNDELMAMEYVDFVNYCEKMEVPSLSGHEDDRLTPIVLLNDSLVGWGWDYWEDLAVKYGIRIR